jgi:hypothetical protein
LHRTPTSKPGCRPRRRAADRRREFDAWCTTLDATPRPESPDFGRVTHLRAIATRYDGLVNIVVLADLGRAVPSGTLGGSAAV